MKKNVTEWIRITIYICMGLQIVFGLGWILCNFTKLPGFGEGIELLNMSETLVVDEYTGFLFPLLLRGLQSFFSWIRIPVWSFLYVIQLVVAGIAYDYFLGKVIYSKSGKEKAVRIKSAFFASFIITIPVVLQVHMAVLPYSLASSLLLILVAKVLVIWREEAASGIKEVLSIALLWVLASQICVEYVWFGGLAVGAGIVGCISKNKKILVKLVVMCIACIISINVLNISFQTPGSQGKIQKSWQAAMMTRIVWPNFSRFSYFWLEDIHNRWDESALRELSTYPETVIYEFGPGIEAMFGKEEANNIYFEMAKRTWQLDTKNICVNILKDGMAYICPPFTAYLQLHGMGNSYTGWNYGRMKDYAPGITGYYMEYALNAWLYIWVAGVILRILSVCGVTEKKEEKKKNVFSTTLYGGTIALGVNLWYVVMSGNMQDYKKVIVCSLFWAMLFVALLGKAAEKK